MLMYARVKIWLRINLAYKLIYIVATSDRNRLKKKTICRPILEFEKGSIYKCMFS